MVRKRGFARELLAAVPAPAGPADRRLARRAGRELANLYAGQHPTRTEAAGAARTLPVSRTRAAKARLEGSSQYPQLHWSNCRPHLRQVAHFHIRLIWLLLQNRSHAEGRRQERQPARMDRNAHPNASAGLNDMRLSRSPPNAPAPDSPVLHNMASLPRWIHRWRVLQFIQVQ